jgi:glutamine synthetase
MYMKFGIDKIPEILLDNTDRNRTSPFAFTGNKFEFRAVGGEANTAAPMTVLNLIIADQLTQFKKEVDTRIAKGFDKRIAIINVLREYIKDSKKIRFEGDGYSEEWRKEAEKRGLGNVSNTPRALKAYLTEKNISIFKKFKVLSERELHARTETMLENYVKKIQIESRVMGDLALNHIIPTAVSYQNILIQNANGLKGLGIDNAAVIRTISSISKHIEAVKNGVNDMIDERRRINKIEDIYEQAIEYCDNVKEKYFETIRYHVDKLELYVDNDHWPLMKYREMLFYK